MFGTSLLIFLLSAICGFCVYSFVVRQKPTQRFPRLMLGLKASVVGATVVLILGIYALHIFGPFLLPGDILYAFFIVFSGDFIFQIIVGAIFGFLVAAWARYITNPDLLQQEHVNLAHRRWGYALLTLLLFGMFTQEVRHSLRSLASVQTPFGSVTLQGTKETSGAEVLVKGDPEIHQALPGFKGNLQLINRLPDFIERDQRYIGAMESDIHNMDVEHLHAESHDLVEAVFVPLNECLQVFVERFPDERFLHEKIGDFVSITASALHRVHDMKTLPATLDKPYLEAIGSIGTAIDQSLGFQSPDGSNADHQKMQKCRNTYQNARTHLEDSEELAGPSKSASELPSSYALFDRQLPYTTLALANLLAMTGSPERAAKEISLWIDEHKATVPLWYVVRAEIELGLLLEPTEHIRPLADVLQVTVSDMDRVLRSHPRLRDTDGWFSSCGDADEDERGLMLAYLTQTNKLAYYAVEVDEVDPEVRRYAARNAELPLDCFRLLSGIGEEQIDTFASDFLLTYGRVLLHTVRKMEILIDEDSREQRRLLQEARNALERALAIRRNYAEPAEGRAIELARQSLSETIFLARGHQETQAEIMHYLHQAKAALKR